MARLYWSIVVLLSIPWHLDVSVGQEITTEPPLDTEPVDGTTDEECFVNHNCCFMYTWPGNEYLSNENTAPTRCDQLPDIEKNPRGHNVACFDPLIYSNTTEGIRPDPEAVREYCRKYGLPCFCATTHQCIKLTYIQNDQKLNETRFCGKLTNVGTNDVMTSGCYREDVEGAATTREVCVSEVTPGYSNDGRKVRSLNSIFVISLIILRFL